MPEFRGALRVVLCVALFVFHFITVTFVVPVTHKTNRSCGLALLQSLELYIALTKCLLQHICMYFLPCREQYEYL